MKNLIANRKLTGLSAIVLALAVGTTLPASQAFGQTKVVANIPFDFQNGSDHLPAGHYIIGADSSHILHLQNGKICSLALTRPEIGKGETVGGKIVFRKYGSRYFLAALELPNQKMYPVMKSKAEKRQQNAMNGTERNGTEVALLEPFK